MLDQMSSKTLRKITNVRIPDKPSSTLWDIAIENGKIASVDNHSDCQDDHDESTLDGGNRLIAPSLCHVSNF